MEPLTFSSILIYLSIYLGLIATTFYIISYFEGRHKERKSFTFEELPKVTIIIPAYNEEKSIKRTIETALSSEYPKGRLEIIVVDDGSKDKTLEIARKMQSNIVRVYTKINGGKASALNLGISKAKGEFIVTMDADTFIEKDSLAKLIMPFKEKDVASVTPSIFLHNPNNFWRLIQQLEYLTGIFLRKTFAIMNSVHITPGAFSAYRKSFFDKYGGYDVGNITEDLEMALRIQSKGYRIENSPDAIATTLGPGTFMSLMVQRRRWYAGLLKNMRNYIHLLNPKYGDMGIVVMPIAWISIFFSVYMLIRSFYQIASETINQFYVLNSVNFDVFSSMQINLNLISQTIFTLLAKPYVWFLILFVFVSGCYLFFSWKQTRNRRGIFLGYPLFVFFFALLFGFWWLVSILYILFNKKVNWR